MSRIFNCQAQGNTRLRRPQVHVPGIVYFLHTEPLFAVLDDLTPYPCSCVQSDLLCVPKGRIILCLDLPRPVTSSPQGSEQETPPMQPPAFKHRQLSQSSSIVFLLQPHRTFIFQVPSLDTKNKLQKTPHIPPTICRPCHSEHMIGQWNCHLSPGASFQKQQDLSPIPRATDRITTVAYVAPRHDQGHPRHCGVLSSSQPPSRLVL